MRKDEDDEFIAFVQAQSPSLLRTAALLTGDRTSGEDLVQTALAKAYAKWDRVRAADNPVAYVHRLMVNTHLSWRRRLASTERVIETVPDRPGVDASAAFVETQHVRAALLQLSPRVRTAVVLRYFVDLPEAETARLMGSSTKTVNNQVSKGLAILRTLLGADQDREIPSRSHS